MTAPGDDRSGGTCLRLRRWLVPVERAARRFPVAAQCARSHVAGPLALGPHSAGTTMVPAARRLKSTPVSLAVATASRFTPATTVPNGTKSRNVTT